jgi:N-acetylglucosamine-6-phosphate deacetylase
MNDTGHSVGVRIITAAPEVDGVLDSVKELSDRGVVFSIGHRYVLCASSTNESNYELYGQYCVV